MKQGAHLTKPQRRLEQDTGGVDRGEAIDWSNPLPIPHPTDLALFGHKITLYSIYNTMHNSCKLTTQTDKSGGSYYCRRLKWEHGGWAPNGPPHFNHWSSGPGFICVLELIISDLLRENTHDPFVVEIAQVICKVNLNVLGWSSIILCVLHSVLDIFCVARSLSWDRDLVERYVFRLPHNR